MAFDQPTRNRLQKFVGDARTLLTEEFTRQMQHDYGLNPATGEVADLNKLTQLDDGKRQTARLMRETLEHYLATNPGNDPRATIERIVREQAFTVLNRLCALRMAEARGLLIESIGKGYQSKGFQLYARLTGSSLGETGDAYRCYLFSLFDEFAVELAVLFDRFSPSGRLFPRESVLLPLLEQINHADIDALWGEDETIGWIYQYFNSKDERKQMRDESAAPRNSRELAVRNQFFTPRYVVEFLTDNTLGRIWFEMTQGQTSLKDSCRYLVRRPDEVFLNDADSDEVNAAQRWLQTGDGERPDLWALAHTVNGYRRAGEAGDESNRWVEGRLPCRNSEAAAEFSTQELLDLLFLFCRKERFCEGTLESLSAEIELIRKTIDDRVAKEKPSDVSQEELLKQPVYIPFRPLKDPRDITMLDPACGSMHFGLYAFDLFERIYDEAWDMQANGEWPVVAFNGTKLLAADYPTKEEFLRDVPRLIIEHNIHGIDIDPRAVQIAGLSLWLRSQKSWQSQGVKPQARPQIRRSNIACAEPMPGEAAFLEDFIVTHLSGDPERQFLAGLVRKVFDSMMLAGEAGSLLMIEDEIAEEVAKAKRHWLQRPSFKQRTLFASTPKVAAQMELDLTHGIADELFWDEAEGRIYEALRAYAEQAESDGGYRRHLFADDAARGFAFIDLCRNSFDIVLMNPPFGECSDSVKPNIYSQFGRERIDLGGCFISRFSAKLFGNGKLGVIANRTLLFAATLDEWRLHRLSGAEAVLDLGHGVLDALVETAATVLKRGSSALTLFIGALDAPAKDEFTERCVQGIRTGCGQIGGGFRNVSEFRAIFGAPFAYWAPWSLISTASTLQAAESIGAIARQGLATCDNFRFLRLYHEIATISEGWIPLTKGGEYQPFWADVPLRVKWHNDGCELKSYIECLHGQWSRVIQSTHLYGIPGATYSERTASSLSLRVLPRGAIFDKVGPFVGADSERQSIDIALGMIGLSYTTPYRFLVETAVGLRDATTSGSAARHYLPSMIQRLPWPDLDASNQELLISATRGLIIAARELATTREPNTFWHEPLGWNNYSSIRRLADATFIRWCNILTAVYKHAETLEGIALSVFSIADGEKGELEAVAGKSVLTYPARPITDVPVIQALLDLPPDELISRVVSMGKAHATIYKKAFWGDRNLELVAHLYDVHPLSILNVLKSCGASATWLASTGWKVLSTAIGLVFGRIEAGKFFVDSSEVLPDDLFDFAPRDKDESKNDSNIGKAIYCDDQGHADDLIGRVEMVLASHFGGAACEQICDASGESRGNLRLLIRNHFFGRHLADYSDFRRQAPIYWPLSTVSGGYTLWVYYHRLTDQTLYTAVNDFVEPKLKQVGMDTARLRQKSGRTSADEKELEQLTDLEQELKDFRDELLRLAKFWKPNLNDGVQITAAPLWKLFRLPAWQKKLKQTWQELEAGDYDWAHLAYSIWPDRVAEKCKTDKSLAIAHNLEHLYVELPKPAKKRATRKKKVEDEEELEDA